MIGYEDPINPTYESTTAMYERVLDEMMRHIKLNEPGKIAVMVASHNEESIRFTLKKLVISVN
jgi:proline dehydrogenase